MSDFKDKTETFKFRPVKEQKPQVNRRENDEYSAARKNSSYHREEEKGSGALLYIAIILSVLLVGVIVAGIFILKPQKESEINLPEEENIIIDEEEEEEEEKSLILSCSMVFYSDSVINKNGMYTVLADLYDDDFYKFDNRKLIIDDATEIREDGKRLSSDALIYIIENMGGEGIVFDGEIDESDGTVLSINFDGSFREEMQEEESTEGVEMNEEVNPEEETSSEEPSPEEVPSEESEEISTEE